MSVDARIEDGSGTRRDQAPEPEDGGDLSFDFHQEPARVADNVPGSSFTNASMRKRRTMTGSSREDPARSAPWADGTPGWDKGDRSGGIVRFDAHIDPQPPSCFICRFNVSSEFRFGIPTGDGVDVDGGRSGQS